MDDCQCDAFVYGMGGVLFRLNVERINVGKQRMITRIIKEIGMVSDSMPCSERVGQIRIFRNLIRVLRI